MDALKNTYNPRWVVYFLIIHVLGWYGAWYAYTSAAPGIVAAAVAYFFACHFAITCGLHRLWAHASYRAPSIWHATLAVLAAGVAQGSILYWSGKHVQHHAEEDDALDPHSPQRDGFFHAHMGWVMKYGGLDLAPPRYIRRVQANDVYGVAEWQHHNIQWLVPLMAFVVPTCIGFILGDWLGGLLVIGFTRLMTQYHLTWVVNSVCHMYGERGKASNSARNLWWLVIPTVGESLHANHHDSWPSYYFGTKWYHFDPGGLLVWAGILLGAFQPMRAQKA